MTTRTIGGKLRRYLVTIVRPFVKRALKDAVADYQDELVEFLKEKIDVPKLTEAEEQKLWNSIYDALEPTMLKVIDRV